MSHIKVVAFIEIPVGGKLRIRFTRTGRHEAEDFPDASRVPALTFAAYGCVPEFYNSADHSAVDAFVLGDTGLRAGSAVPAYIIGIRFRGNGDHKLVVSTKPDHDTPDAFAQISAFQQNALALWVDEQEFPGDRWGDASEAIEWLREITMSRGKAAGIARLAAFASVPNFEIIGEDAFERFLAESSLTNLLADYWQLSLVDPTHPAVQHSREVLIEAIIATEFSSNLRDIIARKCQSLNSESIVARSSASCEDGGKSSWAGQFGSFFGANSVLSGELLCRKCWCTLVSPNVSQYAMRIAGQSKLPKMAVILQEAIDAVASGVVFSFLNDSRTKPIVEATWGLGMPLVQGQVSPERWCGASQVPEQLHGGGVVQLLRTSRDTSPASTVLLQSAGCSTIELRGIGSFVDDGLWHGEAIVRDSRKRILEHQEVQDIISFACARASGLGTALDFEWAIDASRKLWWVQERAVTREIPSTSGTGHSSALVRGQCGSAGKASGIGWNADGVRDVDETARHITFKSTTTPADVQLIDRSLGFVTREGGILSHTAIVCRELGKPCIVGASPFPPAIKVDGELLTIDANEGLVSVTSVSPQKSRAHCNAPFLIQSPQKRLGSERITWRMSASLRDRIPPSLAAIALRASNVPGVLPPFTVLPDLREPNGRLGFPIGMAFHSQRFHPTAVGDCGDGFRLAIIHGADALEIQNKAELLVNAIRTILSDGGTDGVGIRDLRLDRLFTDGLRGLEGTAWEERYPDRVEASGVLQCGSLEGFDRELLDLAQRQLSWHGETGHFLEFLQCDDMIARRKSTVLLLHTGSMELGIKFLARSASSGAAHCFNEGFDSNSDIRDGLWGLDPTTSIGRRFLNNAIGLSNYSFARRAILQKQIETAVAQTIDCECNIELLSDILHTGVRFDGDGILHQQGAQWLKAVSQSLPFVVAGGAGIPSYIVYGLPTGTDNWIGHGKINFQPRSELVRSDFISEVFQRCSVSGRKTAHPIEHDAQAQEAILDICDCNPQVKISSMLPITCIQGKYNGKRKLI